MECFWFCFCLFVCFVAMFDVNGKKAAGLL